MAVLDSNHSIRKIVKGLQLKYPELGLLVDSMNLQESQYDFFRTLVVHIVPFIRKNQAFKTLVNRWDRESRTSRKKIEGLKTESVEEVTAAVNTLSKQFNNSAYTAIIPDLSKCIEEAKGYLDGSLDSCIPPYFEMAAASLVTACTQIVEHGASNLIADLVETISLNGDKEKPCISKCYFYNAISKMKDEQNKWSWNTFDLPFVCWSYLRLAERCWNYQEENFERESHQYHTINEREHFTELLGLHDYWIELQSIRKKHQRETPFFTIERFAKYLEIVCNEILALENSTSSNVTSLGIYAIAIQMDGENLLLNVEEEEGRRKTCYLLHKFNGASNPRQFLNHLIQHPDKDITPGDLEMKSNSPPNLLDRTRITGPIRNLFISKGERKGSIQMPKSRIIITNEELGVRLNVEKQLEEMGLQVYEY